MNVLPGKIREMPLAVVVAALINDGKILLIRRNRGDYVGFWGLPGGKVEKAEHLAAAAAREIAEEAGIQSEFKAYRGCVSEHLVENGSVVKHFLLHVCELHARSTEILNDTEGIVGWVSLDRIEAMRGEIIPSDLLIIKEMVLRPGSPCYECVLEKSGSEHRLKRFSPAAARLYRGSRR